MSKGFRKVTMINKEDGLGHNLIQDENGDYVMDMIVGLDADRVVEYINNRWFKEKPSADAIEVIRLRKTSKVKIPLLLIPEDNYDTLTEDILRALNEQGSITNL